MLSHSEKNIGKNVQSIQTAHHWASGMPISLRQHINIITLIVQTSTNTYF